MLRVRVIYFFLIGTVTLLICILTVTLLQIILYCTLKVISDKLYYKINFYLLYFYYGFLIFYSEWFCNSEIYLYMNIHDFQKYFGKESVYAITNHRSELDLLSNGSIFNRMNMLGNTKIWMKNVQKYMPGVGATLHLSDSIILSRDFTKDKKCIERKMKTLMTYSDNLILAMAPEGTRFSKEKYAASIQYAKKNGLPILKHHLVPRTKGFVTSLPFIRNANIAIYSATWIYSPIEPKIIDSLFLGKKFEAHCFIERIPLTDVPNNEEEASSFLYNLFQQKDTLVDDFLKNGDFRSKYKKEEIIKLKLKSYTSLIIGIFWHLLTFGIILFIFTHLLLNGHIVLFLSLILLYASTIPIGFKLISYMTMKTASSYGLQKDE